MNVLFPSMDRTVTDPKAPSTGNVKERLLAYARHFDSLDVLAVSPTPGGPLPLGERVTVHPLPNRAWADYLARGLAVGKRIHARKKVDVMSTQDPLLTGLLGWRLKQRHGTPLVIHLHGDYIENPLWIGERRRNRAYNAFGRRLLPKADAWAVDGSMAADRLSRRLGLPRDRFTVLPLYVNIPRVRELGKPLSGLYEPGKRHLLFVGQLIPQKNVPNLLRAFKLVLAREPDARLHLVGTGFLGDGMRRLAAELGVAAQTTFHGARPHGEVFAHMASCDVFVLPSNHEGRASVMVEALALERPVVTTDVCGARDVIEDGKNGLVVPLGDPEALARGILAILEDPSAAREMGRRGYESVRLAQDLATRAGDYRAMYDRILGRR